MKRILILVMLAIATLQSSAQTWPNNYTRLNSNYYWRMGAFDALNLPTRDTSLLTGQWVKAGSIIFDSTQAAGSRVWVYNGTYWERLGAGGEGFVSIGAENGLTAVNDSTLRLGGAVDSGAVLQVVNVERMNNRNSRLLITNDTLTTAQADYDYTFTQGSSTSGELLKATKVYRESRGDTLNLQYGGAIQTLYDKFYDSTSSRFVAGGTQIGLNNMGFYGQGRFYPPRDSVDVYTSTFGVTGSVFAGALGFGDSYGYNLYVAPSNPTSNPDLPISVNKMEIDFVREIDQTRRKKMTGTGVTSYFSDWKLLQSTINGSTPTIGNYISKVRGFHAYGGVYTQVGGALTKEQIFAVAKVDTSVGLWVSPQRRALNEVNSGYGFVIEGADDYNYIAGSMKVAGTMPTRDNGGQTETVDVTGSVLGRTAVIGGQRISNNAYLQGSQVDRTKPIYAFGDFLSDAIPAVTHLKDTIGTGYTKKARLMQNDMRYYMNDDYVSFNDAALETNIVLFYVQDSIEINNSGASASTVTGQRNQITFIKHSTQSNPSKVKQSGTTASKAVGVNTSTLSLSNTNMYLDGWYAGYNSIASSSNAGDTIARFVSFNSIPDNAVAGRISKHFALMADAVSNADSAFGVYQVSAGAYNLFGGQTKFGNLTTPTATVDIVGTLRYVDGNQQAGYVMTSDASGNVTWQAPSGGGGSTNLGNTDLTQSAATRNYDIDDQNLYWLNTGTWRIYGAATHSGDRLLEIDGTNSLGYFGPDAGSVFWGFNADSLLIDGIGLRNDSTNNKILVYNPATNTVSYSNWIGGGGSSVSFGTDNQVPFTNSGGTDFDYSSGFTFNGTTLAVNSGADVNVPNTLTLSTSTRSITIGPGAANQGMIQNTGGDNNAGITLRTRLSVDMAYFTRDILYFQTNNADRLRIGLSEAVLNEPGNNYDIRMEGDTDANLFFSDASTDRIGIGTNTPGYKFDVNGMINTPGTEASTYRWAATATEVPATTTYAAPTNYIGSSTNYALFTPDAWLRVNVAGTLYGIPAYIITAP